MSAPHESGAPPPQPEVAKVDYLIDENGSHIEVDEDEGLRVTHDINETVGSTGPTNAWRYAIIGVAIVAIFIVIMQLVSSRPG